MSKQHRDFVSYVRNGVAINALVAFSHDVFTPATETEPASTVEHLTLVYLDPAAASNSIPTGDQLRGSIKTEFSVPPLTDGLVNGWQEAAENASVTDATADNPSFESAILWREYAVALETKLIHAGFPELPPVASEVPRTTPPTVEEINAVELVEAQPPQITPESIAAQDAHDRETGNINESGQTPNEAIQGEQSAPVPAE